MRYLDPINPFPYIYKSHFDFKFDSIKSKVDEFIAQADTAIKERKLGTLERDGGITTVVVCKTTPPHTWDEFDDFKLWLFEQVNDVWNYWNLDPMNKHLSESWINVHPTGAYTAEHHHQNVTVAVAAYLNVPENSGRLLVKNPLQIYKLGEPLDYHYYDRQKDWSPIEVKTNDVLFFPGWLTHKTEKNLSTDNRYVMSLNIMGNYI